MRLLILTLILVAASGAYGQIEWGDESELRGLSAVYIDSDTRKDFAEIKKAIEKAKLNVRFVETLEESEIVLNFRAGTERVVTGANGRITTERQATGRGMVMIFGKRAMRVVIDISSVQDRWGEKRPSAKLASAFIKAFRKANENLSRKTP